VIFYVQELNTGYKVILYKQLSNSDRNDKNVKATTK